MKNFTKIINPTTSSSKYYKSPFNNYIKIEYTDNKLSITGVMGPTSNGDCKGHAGQNIDTICNLDNNYYNTKPTKDFTESDLKKLVDIWNEYHLNDMKPYDVEMKKLGWDKLAKKEIYKITLELNTETWMLQNKIKTYCMTSLKETGSANISEKEREVLNLKLRKIIYSYDKDKFDIPQYYEFDKNSRTKELDIEKTTLGWIYPEEYPDELLGKLCEESGNRYGEAWYKQEIPEDILEWLYNLPDAENKPAWI